MDEEIIEVEELPNDTRRDAVFEIMSNNVSYFTHGFFKYPCKFIPQIPRWAILKYSKEGETVLDPFAGSGTALVEAVLNKRNALGIDFDKLSILLCKTKTTNLTESDLCILKNEGELLRKQTDGVFRPDLRNVEHWFPEKNIRQLSALKDGIERLRGKNEKTYNLLRVCFAATIRKSSFADDISPKPYVSRTHKKVPLNTTDVFEKNLNAYIKNLEPYTQKELGNAYMISEDARKINAPAYEKTISLAVTSPPYINAFDYVRSLRLENAWLGFYGDTDIVQIKRRQIGTEIVSSNVYSERLKETGNETLDKLIEEIYKTDKKRACVVLTFFEDLKTTLLETNRLLKMNSHYVVVVGDSKIRGTDVPTHEILAEIANKQGFRLANRFSYIIKNRYLRIPRDGRGGLIKRDWVLDLEKTHGQN